MERVEYYTLTEAATHLSYDNPEKGQAILREMVSTGRIKAFNFNDNGTVFVKKEINHYIARGIPKSVLKGLEAKADNSSLDEFSGLEIDAD